MNDGIFDCSDKSDEKQGRSKNMLYNEAFDYFRTSSNKLGKFTSVFYDNKKYLTGWNIFNPKSTAELKNNPTYSCSNRYSVCTHSNKVCYSNSKRCIFERNMNGDPLHCEETSHLKNCFKHLCPEMFKCINSYCIGLHMVCDGINDCPQNEDEHNCYNYSMEGYLKCREEDVYVHPVHICDGIINCMYYHDDELICENYMCPPGCICISFAIYCKQGSIYSVPTKLRLLYVINAQHIHVLLTDNLVYLGIVNSHLSQNLTSFLINLRYLKHLQLINISRNVMLSYKPFQSLGNVVTLSIQKSILPHIHANSFDGLSSIRILDLHDMSIRTVHKNAFNRLFTIEILNISNNKFIYLNTYTVTHLFQLKILDLSKNSIYSFGGLFLVKNTAQVIVDNSYFCCYIKTNTCQTKYIKRHNCRPVLQTNTLFLSCCFFSSMSMITATALLYTYYKRETKQNAMAVINLQVILDHLLTGLILLYFIGTHVRYEFNFALIQQTLKGSWHCRLVKCVILSTEIIYFTTEVMASIIYFRVTVEVFKKRPIQLSSMVYVTVMTWIVVFMFSIFWTGYAMGNTSLFCFPLGNVFKYEGLNIIMHAILLLTLSISFMMYVMIILKIISYLLKNKRILKMMKHKPDKQSKTRKKLHILIFLKSLRFIFIYGIVIVSIVSYDMIYVWYLYFSKIVIILFITHIYCYY